MNVEQKRRMVNATLVVRGSLEVIGVLIVTLLILYLVWESSKEYFFAWMRYHLWGYPG